jgi:hypothetical protein
MVLYRNFHNILLIAEISNYRIPNKVAVPKIMKNQDLILTGRLDVNDVLRQFLAALSRYFLF